MVEVDRTGPRAEHDQGRIQRAWRRGRVDRVSTDDQGPSRTGVVGDPGADASRYRATVGQHQLCRSINPDLEVRAVPERPGAIDHRRPDRSRIQAEATRIVRDQTAIGDRKISRTNSADDELPAIGPARPCAIDVQRSVGVRTAADIARGAGDEAAIQDGKGAGARTPCRIPTDDDRVGYLPMCLWVADADGSGALESDIGVGSGGKSAILQGEGAGAAIADRDVATAEPAGILAIDGDGARRTHERSEIGAGVGYQSAGVDRQGAAGIGRGAIAAADDQAGAVGPFRPGAGNDRQCGGAATDRDGAGRIVEFAAIGDPQAGQAKPAIIELLGGRQQGSGAVDGHRAAPVGRLPHADIIGTGRGAAIEGQDADTLIADRHVAGGGPLRPDAGDGHGSERRSRLANDGIDVPDRTTVRDVQRTGSRGRDRKIVLAGPLRPRAGDRRRRVHTGELTDDADIVADMRPAENGEGAGSTVDADGLAGDQRRAGSGDRGIAGGTCQGGDRQAVDRQLGACLYRQCAGPGDAHFQDVGGEGRAGSARDQGSLAAGAGAQPDFGRVPRPAIGQGERARSSLTADAQGAREVQRGFGAIDRHNAARAGAAAERGLACRHHAAIGQRQRAGAALLADIQRGGIGPGRPRAINGDRADVRSILAHITGGRRGGGTRRYGHLSVRVAQLGRAPGTDPQAYGREGRRVREI